MATAQTLLHATPTALDLLSTVLLIGTLASWLWVLPPVATRDSVEPFADLAGGLRRLLLVALIGISVSSPAVLVGRAAEMSARPVSAIAPILPTVVLRTHYGHVWLVRLAALTTVWVIWWVSRRRPSSRALTVLMFLSGAVVAWTRSASGHNAAWGDWSPAQWVDWLHVMSAGLWGGALLAFATVVGPRLARNSVPSGPDVVDLVQRLSTLSGAALAGVLLSGIYIAWAQVAYFGALWTTAYGRLLLAKHTLMVAMVLLGAWNRYALIPLLRGAARLRTAPRADPRLAGIIATPLWRNGPAEEADLLRRMTRTVRTEAILLLGVLGCAALLLHAMPPRVMSLPDSGSEHTHPA
jgi:copper resistance protein D